MQARKSSIAIPPVERLAPVLMPLGPCAIVPFHLHIHVLSSETNAARRSKSVTYTGRPETASKRRMGEASFSATRSISSKANTCCRQLPETGQFVQRRFPAKKHPRYRCLLRNGRFHHEPNQKSRPPPHCCSGTYNPVWIASQSSWRVRLRYARISLRKDSKSTNRRFTISTRIALSTCSSQ